MAATGNTKNDFSKGPVWRCILSMALPTVVAQCVQVLYNVVDRMYIGHIPGESSLALTGLGLTFPIIMLITAFTNLYGMGGGPLCSIDRGRGNYAGAQRIMGNCFILEILTGAVLMAVFALFMRPILYLFGASDYTWPFAAAYLQIYLLGVIPNMIGLGMNAFINAQGFGRVGMLTTVVGCVINLVMDPILIFGFGMGVRGAAIATVFSQTVSCLWVLRFLTGKTALFTLQKKDFRLDRALDLKIVALGFAGFMMSVTNSATQIACNAVLSAVGGDLYVGVMTVINSVREVTQLPCTGLTHGCQPVIGFNYGAGEYRRTRQCILWMTGLSVALATLSWVAIMLWPGAMLNLFSTDQALISAGVPAVKVFFFGYFFMAFQYAAQSTFVAMGRSRHAVFFSTLRKLIIVTPLTFLLPCWGFGVMGVFLAEPISNLIGSLASYITMMCTAWRDLRRGEAAQAAQPAGAAPAGE